MVDSSARYTLLSFSGFSSFFPLLIAAELAQLLSQKMTSGFLNVFTMILYEYLFKDTCLKPMDCLVTL